MLLVFRGAAADPDPDADLLAVAELHFEMGPLSGLRLSGFDVSRAWTGRSGGCDVDVALPRAPLGRNGELRRVLVQTGHGGRPAAAVGEWVAAEYRRSADRHQGDAWTVRAPGRDPDAHLCFVAAPRSRLGGLIADAEIQFEGGVLRGQKLIGIRLPAAGPGDVQYEAVTHVSVPGRPAVLRDPADEGRVAAWIRHEFYAQRRTPVAMEHVGRAPVARGLALGR